MRLRVSLLAFLLTCLVWGPAAIAEPPAKVKAAPKPYLAAKAGCVLLWVDGKFAGSGFMIAGDQVLTCRHVVVGATEAEVETLKGDKFAAKVLRTDAGVDLALLSTGGKGLQVLVLAKDLPDVGDDCWAWGGAYKQPWSLSRGIVAGHGRKIELQTGTLHDLLQADLTVGPGSSGGPLLDVKGHVTGIVVAHHWGNRGFAFAVPASTARAFLDAKK